MIGDNRSDIRYWDKKMGHHYTIVLSTIVWMHLSSLIYTKYRDCSMVDVCRHLNKNRLVVKIVLGLVLGQLLLVRYGGGVFKTVPLGIYEQYICLLLGIGSILLSVVIKTILSDRLFSII